MQEITGFSETVSKTSEVPQHIVQTHSADSPYREETITQWLSRPYPVSNFSWTSTHSEGNRIGSVEFPYALLNIEAIRLKLANIRYFRAGVKISIRLNGTKFHYGKLLAVWFPTCVNSEDSFQAYDNIYSASGFPHVILSPTDNELHEFIMPFALPYSYFDLEAFGTFGGRAMYSLGNLLFYVLNPLKLGPTVTPVDVTVFASFNDVSYAGYTEFKLESISATQLPAQVNPPQPYLDVIYEYYGEPLDKKNNNRKVRFVAEIGTEAPKHGEQKAKSTQGMISGPASAIATVGKLLSPAPVIGGMASAVSSIAGVVGGVARAAGYSMPISLKAIERVTLRQPMLAHTSGLDTAVSLSLDPECKVVSCVSSLGGYEGEMKLANLMGTPGLLHSTVWTAAMETGTSLMDIPVTPFACAARVVGEYDEMFPTPLSYAAAPFNLWRGTICYCLQITCSGFHAGRIRISWEPGVLGETTALTDIDYSNRVSHVLDLDGELEYHFSIPFLSAKPYHSHYDPNGHFDISVVNVLTHANDPIPDVFMNLWMMAGPDFEVGYPTNERLRLDDGNPILQEKFVAEWATREAMKTAPYQPLIPATGSNAARTNIGERVTDVRDLIRRPFHFASTDDLSTNYFELSPFYSIKKHSSVYTDDVYPSYLDWFRKMFRYARGSMIFRFVKRPWFNTDATPHDDDRDVWVATAPTYASRLPDIVRQLSSTDIRKSITQHSQNGLLMSTNIKYQPLEVVVPFYSNVIGMPNAYDAHIDHQLPRLKCYARYGVSIFSSPGDDYELAYQIGPPMYRILLAQ